MFVEYTFYPIEKFFAQPILSKSCPHPSADRPAPRSISSAFNSLVKANQHLVRRIPMHRW
jgi:hypothetical protein